MAEKIIFGENDHAFLKRAGREIPGLLKLAVGRLKNIRSIESRSIGNQILKFSNSHKMFWTVVFRILFHLIKDML